MYQARIYVTLKPTVNDPQGITVLSSLHPLGFDNAEDVRVGKYLLVNVSESDRETAAASVTDMCQKLLTNPVIEEFQFDLEEISSTATDP